VSFEKKKKYYSTLSRFFKLERSEVEHNSEII
jgi:hypothetical protein